MDGNEIGPQEGKGKEEREAPGFARCRRREAIAGTLETNAARDGN